MKKFLSILSFLLIIGVYGYAQQKQSVGIDLIQSNVCVLDEWKKPGLYSPANLFDGDMGTCFAEGDDGNRSGNGDDISCEILFNKVINIDEIRIVNGFAKNDEYYYNNNRVLGLAISFSNNKQSRRYFAFESYILNDTKEWQSLKFKKGYQTDSITIRNDANIIRSSNRCVNGSCSPIIKGKKYNDTCITEVEFYYQGKKVEIINPGQIKKNYIDQIQLNLTRFLSDKTYNIYFTTPDDYQISVCGVSSHKNGNFDFNNIKKNKYFSGDIKTYIPDMWKIENSKLYMRLKGNWQLYKYYLKFGDENVYNPENLYLYTMPFEGLPVGSEFDIY